MQQVHLLNVEVLNALTIIFDATVVGHLDTGHTLQHVADNSVALLLVGTDEVVERVAILTNLLSTDADLLQLHRLFLYSKVNTLGAIGHNLHMVANSQA